MCRLPYEAAYFFGFHFCIKEDLDEPDVDCCHFGDHCRAVCAQAQPPSGAKVTKADAQKVLKIISDDKAKTQTYCDIMKLGDEIEKADEKKADELFQKMDELAKKLGPEYVALMDGLQDINPNSQVGQEIG